MCSRLLSAVLVAVTAHLALSGPQPALVALAVIVAVLFVASLLLSRRGRRIARERIGEAPETDRRR